MKVVWRLGRATVRDVYETLRARRRIAYTTVLTMMKILEDKGHLTRRRVERADVYRPTQPRHLVLAALVRDFIDRVFDGSARPLLVHLARNRGLTPRERREIARLVKAAKEGE